MRRHLLILVLAAAATATASDARPVTMAAVVRSALDAVCAKVLTGQPRDEALHDAYVRGWTDGGGRAQAKSGAWGVVRVLITEDVTECRINGRGQAGPEILDAVDAWAARQGFGPDGGRRAEAGAAEQAWRHGAGLSLSARTSAPAPGGAARFDLTLQAPARR
jgi:hypothetical protein